MVSVIVFSQDFEIGGTYFSDLDHIEYLHGNLPIIISVPHGGEKSPQNIPDRTCENCVSINDAFTQELSRVLVQTIHDKTGCYPFVIINRLHRRKLDPNREIIEAAQGNSFAEAAWEFYQGKIEDAKNSVDQQYSKGLFIDLHGHAHTVQRLELGYLLSKETLMESNETLDQGSFAMDSSIKHLSQSNSEVASFSELLRGANSLGAMLSDLNYPTVPSIEDPFPMSDEAYFQGGYNTRAHGSMEEGTIDAIQIECNQDVRFDEEIRNEFAINLAESLLRFIETNYVENIFDGNCGIVATKEQQTTGLKIIPNPFHDQFSIEYPEPNIAIRIFNSLGEVIYNGNKIYDIKEIELTNFPQGMYFIIGKDKEKIVFREKIIKAQ